jgi:hypothetical protein
MKSYGIKFSKKILKIQQKISSKANYSHCYEFEKKTGLNLYMIF